MVRVSEIRKQYSTLLAVDGVSLEARRGEILGLLGPNGAGKSTTIRMILNIISPDGGTVEFDGKPFSTAIQNAIGYLPEERGLYRKSTLINTILYFASLRGLPVATAKQRAYELLRRFDLLNYHNRKVEELSKGNQQKVQFIIAILHDPALVILDEPYSGLDPINQILLTDILMELKKKGTAIIFSTHVMDQAEKLCDAICLINKGKVVVQGPLGEVKSRFGTQSLRIEYEGDGSFLDLLPDVRNVVRYENYSELTVADGVTPSRVLRSIVQHPAGLEIRKFEVAQPSLNAIFLELVGTHRQDPAGGNPA
jgi:ABC-2 type transport system ATP-binding protein